MSSKKSFARKLCAVSAALLLLTGSGFASAAAADENQPDARAVDKVHFAGGIAAADTTGAGKSWLDVAYGSESQKQKLDIYLPKTGTAPYPVILAFHGRGGDKGTMEVNGEMKGLLRGYAVVSVNYRESQEAKFPANIMDAKAAVRFLKENAKTYHLDKTRIAAWGDSAGGNVVSFLGTAASHPELGDSSKSADDSRVHAVVAWFPALDDAKMDEDVLGLGLEPALPRNADTYGIEMYGAPVQEISSLLHFTNPANYVDANTVPFLIEHGTADNVCPITQSQAFAEKLKSAIGEDKVLFVPVKDAGHHVTDFFSDENIDLVFAFLEKHLNHRADSDR